MRQEREGLKRKELLPWAFESSAVSCVVLTFSSIIPHTFSKFCNSRQCFYGHGFLMKKGEGRKNKAGTCKAPGEPTGTARVASR